MKKQKGWIFLIISLLATVFYFFCAYKQDYAKTTEMNLAGQNPSLMFHILAMIFIIIGGIFWWKFTKTYSNTPSREI